MIDLQNVTVRFGSLVALDRLNLHIEKGEAFGYIGPNGAGKSTTMKILACLLRASEGNASVGGYDVRRDADRIRRMVGYMPDFLGVYDDLTVDEYLQFFAAAFSTPRAERRQLIDGVLDLTDLTAKRHALVDSLSRGMQQRLGVARVLVHDPEVLLLDDPASGLDPRARIEMRELLLELRKMGKTIIISSHILSELHEMCSSIGIIERGRLLFAGTLAEAFAQADVGRRVVIELEGGADRAVALLSADTRCAELTAAKDAVTVHLHPDQHSVHFILEHLVAQGFHIRSFTTREEKLEDVFLRLTKGKVQ